MRRFSADDVLVGAFAVLLVVLLFAERWYFVAHIAPRLPSWWDTASWSIVISGLFAVYVINRRRTRRGEETIDLFASPPVLFTVALGQGTAFFFTRYWPLLISSLLTFGMAVYSVIQSRRDTATASDG